MQNSGELRDRIAQLAKENKRMQGLLNDADEVIAGLDSNLSAARAAEKNVRKELTKVKEANAALEARVGELQDALATGAKKGENQASKIKNLQDELRGGLEGFEQLVADKVSAEAEAVGLKDKVSELAKENKKLHSEMVLVIDELDLNGQITSEQAEKIKVLTNRLKQAERELSDARGELGQGNDSGYGTPTGGGSSLENEIRVAELESEVVRLQKLSENPEALLDASGNEVNRLRSDNQRLKETVSELTAQRKERDNSLAAAGRRIAELEAASEKLEAELAKLNAQQGDANAQPEKPKRQSLLYRIWRVITWPFRQIYKAMSRQTSDSSLRSAVKVMPVEEAHSASDLRRASEPAGSHHVAGNQDLAAQEQRVAKRAGGG